MFVWGGSIGDEITIKEQMDSEEETELNEVDWEEDDKKTNTGLTVLTRNGQFSKNFLKYAKGAVEKAIGVPNLVQTDIEKMLRTAYNSEVEGYSLGPKPEENLNVVEPLTKWLIFRYKASQEEQEEEEEDINAPVLIRTTVFETGEKRQQWIPKPVPGKQTKVKRRLETISLGGRTLSFAEGMLHLPQFVTGGKNSTHYTLINDNATYSIGAYQIGDGTVHLLGGSHSGETFDEGEEGMHAEEQQFAALRDQIEANAHGIATELEQGPVVMHLHISKSPCAERCQKLLRTLLLKYPNLQIQMYLEIPYMANKPNDEMRTEAQALRDLMAEKKIAGRLAYQVVSVLRAKTQLEEERPLRRWGSKAHLILENLVNEKDLNKSVAEKRAELFATLVHQKDLPPAFYVDAMQGTQKPTATSQSGGNEEKENSTTTTQTGNYGKFIIVEEDEEEGEGDENDFFEEEEKYDYEEKEEKHGRNDSRDDDGNDGSDVSDDDGDGEDDESDDRGRRTTQRNLVTNTKRKRETTVTPPPGNQEEDKGKQGSPKKKIKPTISNDTY